MGILFAQGAGRSPGSEMSDLKRYVPMIDVRFPLSFLSSESFSSKILTTSNYHIDVNIHTRPS